MNHYSLCSCALTRRIPVELLKASPERSPFILSQIFLRDFHHFRTLLQQPVFIGSSLPYDLISIQTQHKLRLSSNMIVFDNFRRNIAINLYNLDLAELAIDQFDMFIGYATGGVPIGCEVYHYIWILVEEEIFIEDLEFCEGFYGTEFEKQSF